MSKYEGFKWVKVKRHTYDPTKTWEENYKALDQHHISETSFLIDKVRELAQKVDDATRGDHGGEVKEEAR